MKLDMLSGGPSFKAKDFTIMLCDCQNCHEAACLDRKHCMFKSVFNKGNYKTFARLSSDIVEPFSYNKVSAIPEGRGFTFNPYSKCEFFGSFTATMSDNWTDYIYGLTGNNSH